MWNVFTNRKIEHNYSLRHRVSNNLPEGRTYVPKLPSYKEWREERQEEISQWVLISRIWHLVNWSLVCVHVHVYMQAHMSTHVHVHTHFCKSIHKVLACALKNTLEYRWERQKNYLKSCFFQNRITTTSLQILFFFFSFCFVFFQFIF